MQKILLRPWPSREELVPTKNSDLFKTWDLVGAPHEWTIQIPSSHGVTKVKVFKGAHGFGKAPNEGSNSGFRFLDYMMIPGSLNYGDPEDFS